MSLSLKIRILLAFLVALVFTILPIPYALTFFRPPWVLLVILYIQFFMPYYFNLISTVLLGLCLDVLLSLLLGEHICALIITTWIASTRVRRFPMFLLPQQIAFITLLCFLYQFVLYLIDSYQGFYNTMPMVLITTLISSMIWPWVSLLLNRYLRSGRRSRTKFVSG